MYPILLTFTVCVPHLIHMVYSTPQDGILSSQLIDSVPRPGVHDVHSVLGVYPTCTVRM